MVNARNILLTALLLMAAAVAQEGGDIQAQILYAYQTEDGNGLMNLIQNLANQVKNDGADAALRYHLAHAQYRFGELSRQRHGREAAAAFSDCIDELKPVLEKNGQSAEILALQSACYSGLVDLKALGSVLLRARAAERLQAAFKLAPRNPRVVLLRALQELHEAKPGSTEAQHAFTELQLAAHLFDESPGTNIDTPGWGHAEAYLALGHELRVRGDHLGARNWIEKSLIAAPDYKAAQRQLALLAK
jgi:hypothetical protein